MSASDSPPEPSAPFPADSDAATKDEQEAAPAGSGTPSSAATELDLSGAETSESQEPNTVRGGSRAEAGERQPTLRQATLTSENDADRAQSAPAVDAYVGYIIDGRYHIKKQLAQGGMGVVYQARHRLIDKLVAIKILRPELVHDREIVQRFLTEAQAASSIGSEHIVDITDYGELPDRATYIVMEYLEGRSLTERIRGDEPLEVSVVLTISRQIAEALARAHAAGIVHRDLKPDNVLLVERGKQRDFVKILDFGIAKVASSQNQITRAGKIFGTPHYMSPEQAKGEELDRRTDIYSLGVILYEMIAQQLPFEAENPLGVLTQHMYVEAKPLHEVCEREVPVGLEAIITKCISKSPSDRYSSMLELEEDLARVAEGIEPLAMEELGKREKTPQSLRARIQTQTTPLGGPAILAGIGVASLLAAASYFSRATTPAIEVEPAPQGSALANVVVSGTQEPAEPDSRFVALVLSPIDARVYRGRNDLGPMPLSIRLRPGQRMDLQVRRAGYVTKTIRIDGTEPRLVVELEPIPGAPKTPLPTSLPNPETARTISFTPDAGAVVFRSNEPVGHDEPHDGGVGAQVRAVEAPSPEPTPDETDPGHRDVPTLAHPPGPPPRSTP